MVRTPDGDEFEVTDPGARARARRRRSAIKQHVGVFDTMPLSLITTQAIASLGAWVEPTLTPQRFRPNLLIDATDDAAFPEDGGSVPCCASVSMRMRVDRRDVRCVMINIDPVTDERIPTCCARWRASATTASASTARRSPRAGRLGAPGDSIGEPARRPPRRNVRLQRVHS